MRLIENNIDLHNHTLASKEKQYSDYELVIRMRLFRFLIIFRLVLIHYFLLVLNFLFLYYY